MNKIIIRKTVILSFLIFTLFSLSSCSDNSYDEGYDFGYDVGYDAGYVDFYDSDDYYELLDRIEFLEEEYDLLEEWYEEDKQLFLLHLFSENKTYIKENQKWTIDNFEIEYYTETTGNTKYLCYCYRLVNENISKYYSRKDVYSSYSFQDDCPLKNLEIYSFDGTSYTLMSGDIYNEMYIDKEKDYASGEYVFDKIKIDNNLNELHIVANVNNVFYTSILTIR